MIGRIVIEDVRPAVDGGQWPGRAVVGQTVRVAATIFRDGHDPISACVRLRGPRPAPAGGHRGIRAVATVTAPLALVEPGTDRWEGEVVVGDRTGMWELVVEAWTDPVAAWREKAVTKLRAGQDVQLELREGAGLLEAAARRVPEPGRQAVGQAVKSMRVEASQADRLGAALDREVVELLAEHPIRASLTRSRRLKLWVDRQRALYGSWYEFFPRSEGAAPDETGQVRSGTLSTAAERLPAIAEMGFDVVYLPPIHPIGHSYRKGPNNTTVPGPGDPGSPWAIGSEAGGHTAVHPELGTLEDFDRFVARARKLGMEVALDYALQCSPDHPWVSDHPEWFHIRADGSIAYAENPPKKYQDIYPLNFDGPDAKGLFQACREVLEFWIGHGVRIFRVDNPHTKPVRLWEWLIWQIKADHPDVLFLSEAFTRPPMMKMLAKVGFTQSYTYFTWRNTKQELEEYLGELAHGPAAGYMRPNLFVNTPDILHEYLQHGGPAAFKIRAVLASMASPSWGVYSGYELCEHTPVRPGSEEYLDSEKYQLRPRDWSQPSLVPYLARLNRIRREHPALTWLHNLRFHLVDNGQILAFSKRDADGVVLAVVNLDPHQAQEAMVNLWMPALGLGWQDTFEVADQLTGAAYVWHGPSNYVRLDPTDPAHVFVVRPIRIQPPGSAHPSVAR